MSLLSRFWLVVITLGLTLTCLACRPSATEKPTKKEPASTRVREPAPRPPAGAEKDRSAHKQKPEPPPPPPTIPKVVLSDALRAACLINVGDTMPAADLSDAAGKVRALKSLYGKKLTVLSFWTMGVTVRSQIVAGAALEDLQKDVAEPFGRNGVRVIGINVGDTATAVQEQTALARVTFPNLLDPKGAFFAKIAKDKQMPRTYLLDAQGKVIWFDVEYSRASRRDLMQSIRAALGEGVADQ